MSTVEGFLPKNRASRYHRIHIPKRLRPFFGGRSEVWRSLGTTDAEQAEVRVAEWGSRSKRLFLTLKRHGHVMNKAQIDQLIAHWLDNALEEAEDYRAVVGLVTDEYRDDVSLILSDQLQEASEALVSCDYRKIEKEADELLQASGLPLLNHAGVEFGRFCRKLLLAKQEYLSIEADRWEGKYQERVPRGIKGHVYQSSTKATPAGKLFSEVVSLYFKENTRATRTDAQVKAELTRFVTVLGGDRPVTNISKADCRTYKDDLLQTRKLSLATCIKHLSSLSGLFKWSEAQGFIPENSNPVKGLAPNKRQAKKQAAQRRPFTDGELLSVFSSKEFTKQREDHPERYWLCLLCLFQICRREEAGQLNISDIGEAEGIPYLSITDEGEGQGLKNQGSKRKLPIHSSLIKLGFLEYVSRTKQAEHTRLFPQLKRGANGYSDAVGKFFSRLVTKAGLVDPALVLHSFRHGGITKLHAAGVSYNIVEVIAGHSADNVHGQVYLHRDQLPLSLLKKGLDKLRYDEVVKGLL